MANNNEIPPGQRLKMEYAGSKWLHANLQAAARNGRLVRGKRSHRSRPIKDDVSPLGETVADVLGFVWRGLYHLPWAPLSRVDWSDPHCIDVPIPGGVATVDYNEITQLVVLSHDLGLRLAIDPNGPIGLLLTFHQRAVRSGSLFERCPTLESHSKTIRNGYTIVTSPGEPTPS